jgi:predicted O-methyltransferase YrrM
MFRDKIHKVDPYKGFDETKYPQDVQGWNGNSTSLTTAVEQVKPKFACEVGSWKGMSAANIASTMKRVSPAGCELVCVDTWSGAPEFWTWQSRVDLNDHSKSIRDLQLVNGYPTIYYQFLANMKKLDLQDIVTPLPVPSSVAYEIFRYFGVQFDLIYVDAAHEYKDVKQDIDMYWELLAPGGMMLGDDYGTNCWLGVTKAVDEFARKMCRNVTVAMKKSAKKLVKKTSDKIEIVFCGDATIEITENSKKTFVKLTDEFIGAALKYFVENAIYEYIDEQQLRIEQAEEL